MIKLIKSLLAFSAVAAVAVSLAACAPANPSTSSTDGGTTSSTGASTGRITITTAADLDKYKVGCQSSTTGESWFKTEFGKDSMGFKSGMDAALALNNGQIDAIVLDELPAKAIVEKNKDLQILDITFAKEEYAIAIAKGNTELQASINKTIANMKESGKYEELVGMFMPVDGKVTLPEASQPANADKVLKMGTNAAFPPFEYVEGDKIVGFDVSMGELIASDFGAKFEVKDMEFNSLVAALQSGAIDFIAAGMSITPERLESVDFSDPYYESQQVIIVKK